MPRKGEVPENELVICQRLRAFRVSTGISRTVFTFRTGLVGVRLDNCEAGRTPVNYGVFKAVHQKYSVSPRWLVTGQGNSKLAVPIEEPELDRIPLDREWLSVAYEQSLKPYLESRADESLAFWTSPDGFKARLAELIKALADPAQASKYPPDFLRKMERDFLAAGFDVSFALKEESKLNELVKEYKARRKRRA